MSDLNDINEYSYDDNDNLVVVADYFSKPHKLMNMAISTVAFEVHGIINSNNPQEKPLKLSIYNGERIYAKNDDGFVLKVQEMFTNCTDETCSLCGTDGTCYSCLVPSDKPYLHNNTCVVSCPEDTVATFVIC